MHDFWFRRSAMRGLLGLAGGVLMVSLFACSDDGEGGGPKDAAADAPLADSAAPDAPADAGSPADALTDALPTAPDSGPDLGAPPAPDAGGADVLLSACTPGQPQTLGVGASVAPALLWGDNRFTVLWGDAREDAPGIYLRRLSAEGLPEGIADVQVGAGTIRAKNPEIAPHAGGYLVTWEDCTQIVQGKDGPECASWLVNARLLDATFAPTGTVKLMAETRPIERRPYVLSALGKTFVTFRDSDPNDATKREWIKVFAVDAAADALATPPPKLFDVAGLSTRFPFLSTNGTHLAVAYVTGEGPSELSLALLDGNLSLVQEAKLRTGIPGPATNPQAAWLGSEWLVTWEDSRGGQERIWAAFVAGNATSVRTAFSVFDSVGLSSWPTLGFDGTNALVAFHAFPDGAQVIGQQYTPAGVALRGPIGISPLRVQNGRFPVVVHTGTEYAVAYVDRKSSRIGFLRMPCP
ncbi:MAG: hypothetical protein KA712_10950 [Myxococcales bacterium]|nr:hypothetical protein [Myxococcales bacterium]